MRAVLLSTYRSKTAKARGDTIYSGRGGVAHKNAREGIENGEDIVQK